MSSYTEDFAFFAERNKKSSETHIYQRGEKTQDNPYGFAEVPSIPADETCVVYLGGDGSITPRAANGYAKVIEEDILEPMHFDIPVYSVKYTFGVEDNEALRDYFFAEYKMSLSRRYETHEERYPQYIVDLYENIIKDRISRNGEKLPVEEAMKNLRKVNFVAHCHGGVVALKLENLMQHKMKDMGYSKADREAIQKQMLVVAHAPACPLGVSKSTFISFMSAHDNQVPFPDNHLATYIYKRMKEDAGRYYADADHDTEKMKKYRYFNLEPTFLEGYLGDCFLVKHRFYYDREDGPLFVTGEEHGCVSYEKADNMTEAGRRMVDISRNVLVNGIRNSLKQQDGFTPIPPLNELILSDDADQHKSEQRELKIMTLNGKKLEQEVLQYATKLRSAVIKGQVSGR